MKVVVVGTGRMAPGIAVACSGVGSNVVVVGRSLERARAAVHSARELGAEGIEAGLLDEATLARTVLAIETVVEDAKVKRSVLAQVEALIPREAVLATNTSGLSITELASDLRRPERFAGLHFLNPAHLTFIAEVIPGDRTSADTMPTQGELVLAMGKTPLSLTFDMPGGLWNRLQFALLREAVHLLKLGVASAATIDAAVSDGLAPRWVASGPLATADLGGLDTFGRAAAAILPTLDDSAAAANALSALAEHESTFFAWTDDELERAKRTRRMALRLAADIRAERPNPRASDEGQV